MGSKNSGGSQTTETNPWGPAQDALKKILADAGSIYDEQGGIKGNWVDKEIADLTPEMQQAVKDLLGSDQMKQTIGNITQAGQAGLGSIGQAQGALGGLTQQGVTGADINKLAGELYDSDMVKSQKEQMGKDIEGGLNKRVQGINQQSAGSGNMGSSRAGVAEGVAIGDASDAYASGAAGIENSARQQAYGQALGTLQGNQSTALGAAGQLGSLGLGSGNMMNNTLTGQNQILQNQLQGAGIGQNQNQNVLNNKWFNQQGQNNAGWDNINKYLGIAGSIGGMGGTQTGSAQQGGIGQAQGLAGLVSTGIGIAGMFSDASMKKKIKRTGKKTKGGETEYEWEWNDSGKKVSGKRGKGKGVLAQQVAKNKPDAVMREKKTGKLMVDYNKV
ncbi:MAG: hypothetical protein ACRC6V_04530 [Bacteroidales bacterium]